MISAGEWEELTLANVPKLQNTRIEELNGSPNTTPTPRITVNQQRVEEHNGSPESLKQSNINPSSRSSVSPMKVQELNGSPTNGRRASHLLPQSGHFRKVSIITQPPDISNIKQLEELEKANKHLETEVENLQVKVAGLEVELEAARAQESKLTKRITELKKGKSSAEKEVSRTKRSVKRVRSELKDLAKKHEEAVIQVTLYEDLQHIRRAEFEKLQQQPVSRKGSAYSLNLSISSPVSFSETDLAEIPTSPVSLGGSLLTFRNQVNSLQEKIGSQEKEIENRDGRITKLEKKIAELQEPQSMIAALNEELGEVKERYLAIENKLEGKRDLERNLTEELVKHKMKLQLQDELHQETEEMIRKKNEEINELRDKVFSMSNECLDANCAHAMETKNIREEKERRMKSLKSSLADKEQELEVLQGKISKLISDKESKSKSASKMKLGNEISLLQSDLIEREMGVDVQRASLLNFSLKQVDKCCLGCGYLETEIQRNRNQRREIEAKLVVTQNKLAEAEIELDSLRSEMG